MEEEQYIEVAIRVKKRDWDALPSDIQKKICNSEDPIIPIDMDCEVLAFGVDGFISSKID
jgi:hypothetical protein